MIKSMKFSHNNSSLDVCEADPTNRVRVAFWNDSPGSYGYVDLDEEYILDLVTWLTTQRGSIIENKKKQTIKK